MNVTYILGAGASAQALPTVGPQFNQQFIFFCEIVKNLNQFSPNVEQPFINAIIKELPNHYSVDTYARKLFFRNIKQYKAFKVLLSAFFLFKQFQKRGAEGDFLHNSLLNSYYSVFPSTSPTLDPRYDVIYAALLDENTLLLPKNISFISWNYDIQMELSLASFLSKNIDECFKLLKTYPAPYATKEAIANNANHLKLNGTAGLTFGRSAGTKSDTYYFSQKAESFSRTDLEICLAAVINELNNQSESESLLHFAWENVSEVDATRNSATKKIKETDILIIIGYSFPVYNRRIDRQILKQLETRSIYLQVPDKYFNPISERFKTVSGYTGPITHIQDLDQFYIPDEII